MLSTMAQTLSLSSRSCATRSMSMGIGASLPRRAKAVERSPTVNWATKRHVSQTGCAAWE
jgi:hypothetical protein